MSRKIAPTLSWFCSPLRKHLIEHKKEQASRELHALLAVARAADAEHRPICNDNPEDCEVCRALARLDNLSKGTP